MDTVNSEQKLLQDQEATTLIKTHVQEYSMFSSELFMLSKSLFIRPHPKPESSKNSLLPEENQDILGKFCHTKFYKHNIWD